ncbi:response regulator transcription factor [Bifidobacterium sp. 64T4]|uniref:response regulator transcription factor n=1 Tax=Bifidobacterium pongonis TaxID=2834432 RepID=UPI001C5841B1|nr:response regulator transcription factor [Bifidobacterium pongonis]MBW3094803.1 response regulator transcription factor [Bifidobacterium pongonis]
MLSLGIVDNDPLVAQAIENVLIQRQAPLKVLWSVTGAADAIDLCNRDSCRPNVVLTDMEMPGADGFALSGTLHRRWPGLVIVGMTAFAVDTARMHDVGMSSIVHKDVPVERLVHRIGAAAHDEEAIEWIDGGVSAANLTLTETERQVLTLFLKGRTVLAVARQLHMSEGTVKTHMNSAYKKLGVHNRSQAIGLCVKKGII